MINDKKRIVISVFVIILITGGAYLYEDIMKNQGVNNARIIEVTEKEKVVAYLSSDVLRQIMEQNLGEETFSKGPSFALAISAAGISEFKTIEVKGKEQKESVVLSQADIDDDLILYLSPGGTMNLCKKDSGSNSLVKEIIEISIRE